MKPFSEEFPSCKKKVWVFKMYLADDTPMSCCRECGTVFVDKKTLNELEEKIGDKSGL